MTVDIIKQNYLRGLWTEAMVEKAVERKVITEAQQKEIFAAKKQAELKK